MLNGKEEEIRDARNVDHEAFKIRSNNYDSVVKALNEILGKLVEAVASEQGKQGSFSEVSRNLIVRRIREELGANHPIAMMVSLSTKYLIW